MPDLVALRGHEVQQAGGDGARQRLVVEGPQILDRAAAAHQQDQVDRLGGVRLSPAVQLPQRALQFGRRARALHRRRRQQHRDVRHAPRQRMQHVAPGRRTERGDHADAARQRRQRALALGVEPAPQRPLQALVLRLGRPSGALATERLRLDRATQRLRHALALRLERERAQWARRAERLARTAPPLLAAERQRLARLAERLPAALMRQRDTAHERLTRAVLRLDALDPQRVLERGYAWLEDERGRPVTQAAQTRPGQPLAATLADGQVDLTVVDRRLG